MSNRLEDIEEVKLPKENDGPHDSAAVYSQIFGRHTERVFPTLTPQDKSRGQWIIIGVLVFMVVMGAWGTAYEVQIQVTPQVLGICPPPATIQNGGCFTAQTTTDAQGNSHTVLVPAGHLGG